jgi:flagellar protein FlgJ
MRLDQPMRVDQPTVLTSARSARIEGRSGRPLSRPGGDREPPLRTDTGLDALQNKRLADACKDFEALFLASVLKAMRKTVPKTDLFGSDTAQDTFQEMMDDEIGKSAAKTSSMGIADMLYRQLTSEMARGEKK